MANTEIKKQSWNFWCCDFLSLLDRFSVFMPKNIAAGFDRIFSCGFG